MKTTSRFALVAAAGFMMGSVAMSSAKAADLGGDCCADLEERVADLEATTVRKGNRKVSLELSGQVNKGLLIWNDGKASDAYVTDYNASSTRFRLRGTGQMAPGWKAGFYMEYEFRDSSTNLVDQTNAFNRDLEGGSGRSLAGPLRIRQENVFVESEKFGRVTLGQQSTAAKDIEIINLGGGIQDAENYMAAAFRLRDSTFGTNQVLRGGAPTTVGTATGTTVQGANGTPLNAAATGTITQATRINWGALADTFDTGRLQAVRYDTPSLYGFIFSAAWGEDDYWDVALRYQKEWNSIRIAAGIGYYYAGDNIGRTNNAGNGSADAIFNTPKNVGLGTGPTTTAEVVKGSISVLHIPTGIYASFMAGERMWDKVQAGALNKDATFYYIQAGITKRFFDVGATTFYGEYGNYDNQGVGAGYTSAPTNGSAVGRITSSNVDRWGVGFTQAFDGAALELYANYVHYSADINFNLASTATAAGFVNRKGNTEDFDAVLTGARIKF
jgi:predicted porin